MIKLKTPGIITMSEYHQAELASQLTIAEAIVCCYCPEPVEVNPNGSETLLDCQQHGTMRLEFEDKMFYLHRLNGRLLDEEHSDLAENKGCPFCKRNLKVGITYNHEIRLENQLLRYPLHCGDCEMSFYVIEYQGKLRFQPKPEHFQHDIETTSFQLWHQPHAPEETNTAGTVEVPETRPTQTQLPAINIVDNDSDKKAAAPAKKGKNVRAQILSVLQIYRTPLRRKEIQALVDGNVVKPLGKLVEAGRVVQPRRGYYSLP